jgi:tetratricopeptide (TPR) repeat protein
MKTLHRRLAVPVLPLLRVLLMLAALLLATAAGLALSALQASAGDDLKALAERGQWKRLRAAVAQLPAGDAETAWLQSRVKQAFGDLPAALAQAEQAVRLDPRNADYRVQLAEVVGPMAQKAGPLKGLSLGKRFKKETEAAIALDPRHVDARINLMMFHLQAPGIAGGDKKQAVVQLEEIARIDPLQGHLARMQWAMARKDSAAAEAALRQAVAIGDASFEVQMRAANFHAARRAHEPAEKHARRALSIDAARPGPYMLLAILAVQQGHDSEADATLAAAEAALPGNLGAHYQAARALIAARRDPARAERWLRRYLEVEPEGFAPQWAHARWRLGLALEQQGKTAAALAEIERAVAMNPDLDDAKKDLKRIRQGKTVAGKE